ncbi:branched-chain amino acid ABC transporter permease [Variovorax sp. EL159]|uniref:branched-chain amino acid ABC transporter permease n=1 Tax=Variovorax sp. EL159 TaxID=1566270 RepID=UPI00087EF8AD|nr:branched-chain amino acid ABC transporter permease [Variovorax sp. EL159]SCX72518.1 branched-chain amino acid transport system permease protein [Variovorax sp. EL159]
MTFWLLQALNSIAFGGVLFLLSVGLSLIFGLMRIPNLSHGALFMLGAYVGYATLSAGMPFWVAAIAGAVASGAVGAAMEFFLLRRLASNEKAQVLLTIGMTFIISDSIIGIWGGDPRSIDAPEFLRGAVDIAAITVPPYRLALVAVACVVAVSLWVAIDRTRIGAMLRAGVDDRNMARAVGIPVYRLFTLVFTLGAALAGLGGVLAGPVLSAYPGLDLDMLPLALIVVILGGVGSLAGALLGSVVIGFIYTLGQALLPDLAYVILFLPMVIVLAVRPQGLFGRAAV